MWWFLVAGHAYRFFPWCSSCILSYWIEPFTCKSSILSAFAHQLHVPLSFQETPHCQFRSRTWPILYEDPNKILCLLLVGLGKWSKTRKFIPLLQMYCLAFIPSKLLQRSLQNYNEQRIPLRTFSEIVRTTNFVLDVCWWLRATLEVLKFQSLFGAISVKVQRIWPV